MTPKMNCVGLLTSHAVPTDNSRSPLLTTDAVPTDNSRSAYRQVTQYLLTTHAVGLLTTHAVGTASLGSIRSSSRRLKPFTKILSRRGFTEFLQLVLHEDTQLVATCGRKLAPCGVLSQSRSKPSGGSR